MTPFTSLTAPALVLPENRIDTDVIFPARYLLLTQRDGLGDFFCRDRRTDGEDRIVPNPIDEAMAQGAGILITGKEFGCGSSREQAVWTILDFGISCVIAESFGEIFQANCLRNGVLPIVLDPAGIDRVVLLAATGPLTVDLAARTIGSPDVSEGGPGNPVAFEIADNARERLLNGWDETAMIQERWGAAIEMFESRQRGAQPWLYEELSL